MIFFLPHGSEAPAHPLFCLLFSVLLRALEHVTERKREGPYKMDQGMDRTDATRPGGYSPITYHRLLLTCGWFWKDSMQYNVCKATCPAKMFLAIIGNMP